ncbi:hypothetical protein STEG23_001030, partial [Scotinomys teguina]
MADGGQGQLSGPQSRLTCVWTTGSALVCCPDTSCSRTMDPDMAFGSSPGTDNTMAT